MHSEEQDEIEVEAEVELRDDIVTHSVGGGVSGEPDASLHLLHNNAHWGAMVVPHPYAHLGHNSVLGLQSEEHWDTTELLAELNYAGTGGHTIEGVVWHRLSFSLSRLRVQKGGNAAAGNRYGV
eukprot:2645724-Prymnesium_polylepis.1